MPPKRKRRKANQWSANDGVIDDTDDEKKASSQEICYDYEPNIDEDVLVWNDGGSFELVSIKCKGCTASFDNESSQSNDKIIKRFIDHCVDCQTYKFLDLLKNCPSCDLVCLNDQSLSLHLKKCLKTGETSETEKTTAIKDNEDNGPSVAEEQPPKKKRERKPEVPLVLTDKSQIDIKTDDYSDICYEYVPSEVDGDEVVWKSPTLKEILSTKCKGCGERFPTTSRSLQRAFITHCIRGCEKYQQLDRIKFCCPCNMYCIDNDAFMQHMSTDTSCLAHECMVFSKAKKNGNSTIVRQKTPSSSSDSSVKVLN